MSFEPIQEDDRIAGRRIAAIAVASIAITAVSIAAAWLVMIHAGEDPEAQAHAAPPPPGLGHVERSLAGETERGVDLRRSQRRELEGLGWVDRDAGIAHVPIDRAIDLYLLYLAQADGGAP